MYLPEVLCTVFAKHLWLCHGHPHFFPKTESGDAKDDPIPQTCGNWANSKNLLT